MRKYLFCATAILFAPPLSVLEAKQDAAVVVTPILKTAETVSGQPIVLPQKDVQVLVSTYQIAPGATLPEHKHMYPRYGYVLEGIVQVTNAVTGKSNVFKAGDFIVESIGQWHKGANIGTTVAKLLVIDQVEKGQSNVILQK